MSFFFKSDALMHHGTDIGRLAKSIRHTLKERKGIELTQPEALEIVCAGLGAKSLYAARKEAHDPVITGMSGHQIDELRRARSITKGEQVPRDLLDQHDLRQKHHPNEKVRCTSAKFLHASNLFDKAMGLVIPGKLQFIAVVGVKGAGKSLLLADKVYKFGGLRIDTSQNIFDRGDYVNGKKFAYPAGSILAYDRPAGLDPKKYDAFAAGRAHERGAITRLSRYEALQAIPALGIPHDDAMLPHLRNWLREEPNVTLAVTFDSHDQVVDAVSTIAYRTTGALSDDNWERIYVVNLDDMTLSEVEITRDGPVTKVIDKTAK